MLLCVNQVALICSIQGVCGINSPTNSRGQVVRSKLGKTLRMLVNSQRGFGSCQPTHIMHVSLMVMLVIGASREVPLSSIHLGSWTKRHHIYAVSSIVRSKISVLARRTCRKVKVRCKQANSLAAWQFESYDFCKPKSGERCQGRGVDVHQ